MHKIQFLGTNRYFSDLNADHHVCYVLLTPQWKVRQNIMVLFNSTSQLKDPLTGTWNFHQFQPKIDIHLIFHIPCFLTKLNNLNKNLNFLGILKWKKPTLKHYNNKLENLFDGDRSFKTCLQPRLGAQKVEKHCSTERHL